MNRFRRLRKNSVIRDLVRETHLDLDDVIQPYFIVQGRNKKQKINAMPGIYRYSPDLLLKSIEGYMKKGGKAGIFFGIPFKKDALASEAYAAKGAVQTAIKAVKKRFPEFFIITDVCLCAYTNHGHCGIIKDNIVDNDKTLSVLNKIAVSHAEAGCDMVAPSDMMDFRVKFIRQGLDKKDFTQVGVLSHAVKYASAFYGPFRDAASSAPQFGDRKSYQMDFSNQREALKEARQDVEEGADIIMVKPALAYLDIVALLRNELTAPIAAYSVSGEYSMIKAAAQKKWINEKDLVLESATAIKRAGADIIITYYAEEILRWIQ